MKHAHVFSLALIGILGMAAPLAAAELNGTATLTDVQPTPSVSPTVPQFSKVIEDLPIMQGLDLQPDNDVLFVTPRAGRIAETTATGPVDVDDVYRFYRRTLPQMGWKPVGARTYVRENDRLTIVAKALGKEARVTFSLTPLSQ